MKIQDIQTILLAHEKTDPPMRRTYALVRVEAEGGLVGYGEASSNYGHSYPTVIKTIVEDVVARNIVGKDARDIRSRLQEMHVLLDGYLGWDGVTGQVIGAIEIALWDLVGKEAGLPISRLLGATTTSFPLYGTGTTMFGAPPQWYAEYYDDCLARGFAGVKVRLGTDIRESVERVATVREHVGPDILVMVDAYWGYSTDDALALTHKLAPYDVFFFEEPSPQYQLAGFRRLCASSPIPIAVGERVYSPSHVQAIVNAEAAHVIEPDATICGGILACMDIAAIARTNDIRIVPHVGSPTPVGLAANLHWAAAAACELMEFDIDPYLPVLEELAPGTAFSLKSISDGRLSVPTGPGLGIDVDESAFARFPYDKGGTYAEVFPDHESARLRRVQT
ncbi:mandelate racemase/muconate lactonizing enzyme family protein [Bauldia sp.]|uniref:mandelate racemase/muconate lactonizing enzyme family protein n=1 Tax=Bauldia sp. TaxID=2575872 RepID=UPI003BA9E45D